MHCAVARAPGRVNLIGDHTDYHRGLALPYAIEAATTVCLRARDDDLVRARSTWAPTAPWRGTRRDLRDAEGWARYVTGVLAVLAASGRALPGLDIEVASTVPVGAGLSSSAALEAATALAAVGLLGEPITEALRVELAELCRRAETEVVGAPTGGLDQTAVLSAPAGGALLLDFDTGAREPVPLRLDDAGLRLLVIDTGTPHAHVDGGYRARREQSDAAAVALGVASLRAAGPSDVDALTDPLLRRRARHVVTENLRVRDCVAAVDAGAWAEVGALMTASHQSLRDDYEASCAELDLAASTALEAGALGARMTGGGFGGSAVALVPTARVEAVRLAVDLAFAAAGIGPPTHVDGRPGGPAELISVR